MQILPITTRPDNGSKPYYPVGKELVLRGSSSSHLSATHSRIMRQPLGPAHAIRFIDEWLQQPGARTIAPGEHHWPILRNLLELTGTAANLTSDAHLAVVALEHGCTIYSADHDFKRFPGLKHVNPVMP